jgi:hypothetical protein
MPKKGWTTTKLNNELWLLVANWIKKRDGNQCWHCKKVYDNKSAIHCSHILPKGEYPNYAFQSWNLKTLCMHCHLQWWHKNPIAATIWFQSEYPVQHAKAVEMMGLYKSSQKMSPEDKMKLYLKLKSC